MLLHKNEIFCQELISAVGMTPESGRSSNKIQNGPFVSLDS